jgi:intraflagellar transport protein 52
MYLNLKYLSLSIFCGFGYLSWVDRSLSFVYAYGATLTVQRPAVAILSSGGTSYPLNRPVCAFCTGQLGKGKLAVIGSAHMFSDSFLNKEENKTVKITIM